MKGKCC